MADLFLALLHHPVLDKNGQIVTTAVTNMDIHDIARSACTYGVRRFFVVTPVRALRALSEKIIEHWETGYGSTYNAHPQGGPGPGGIEPDLDGALVAIERETGKRPDAGRHLGPRRRPTRCGFAALRPQLASSAGPHLLVLRHRLGPGPGGHGARRPAPRAGRSARPPTTTSRCASAAAVILDRLRGAR